jgi:hypothetical protein
VSNPTVSTLSTIATSASHRRGLEVTASIF